MLRSARSAYGGLWWSLSHEPSLQLALAVSVALSLLAALLRFSALEFALLAVACTLLLVTETFNTVVEMLCDALHPEAHPLIGRVKDVSAGATAWSELGLALTAAVLALRHL